MPSKNSFSALVLRRNITLWLGPRLQKWQSVEMEKPYKNFDDAFLNSAYLSERWAVRDLVRIKKEFPESWGPDRERQLADEARHSRLLLNELKKSKVQVVDDISYSMQERLFRKYINLGASNSASAAGIVHNVTEARALWIYRTYMKIGTNESYKRCVAEIVEDEKQHFLYNSAGISKGDSFLEAAVRGVDRALFRGLLPQKFGALIFNSPHFWAEYYKGAKASPHLDAQEFSVLDLI